MNKKLVVILLGLSLVLSACAGKNSANQTKNNSTSVKSSDVKTEENNLKNSKEDNLTETKMAEEKTIENVDSKVAMTKEEAFDGFISKYPNAKVENLSFSMENNMPVFEVEGYDDMNEYELKYDAATKKEIGQHQEKDTNTQNLFVSREQLQKIDTLVDEAKKDFGSDVKNYEYSLGFDDGRLVVSVEIRDNSNREIEYKYDFESEKLIEKDM